MVEVDVATGGGGVGPVVADGDEVDLVAQRLGWSGSQPTPRAPRACGPPPAAWPARPRSRRPGGRQRRGRRGCCSWVRASHHHRHSTGRFERGSTCWTRGFDDVYDGEQSAPAPVGTSPWGTTCRLDAPIRLHLVPQPLQRVQPPMPGMRELESRAEPRARTVVEERCARGEVDLVLRSYDARRTARSEPEVLAGVRKHHRVVDHRRQGAAVRVPPSACQTSRWPARWRRRCTTSARGMLGSMSPRAPGAVHLRAAARDRRRRGAPRRRQRPRAG